VKEERKRYWRGAVDQEGKQTIRTGVKFSRDRHHWRFVK